jgi:predicted RNA-binding Zn ribbon-like protein
LADTESFSRVGGALSLDFANTVTWRTDGLVNERWPTADAFFRWAVHAGALSPSELRAFQRRRGVSSFRDGSKLATAMRFRSILHDLFSALAGNANPPARAVSAANRFFRVTQRSYRLEFVGRADRYLWDVDADQGPFEMVLARVASSALSVLTSDDSRAVKLCANPECGWLFLDESRRGNRRWCDMSECGARHKARTHYVRHHRKRL